MTPNEHAILAALQERLTAAKGGDGSYGPVSAVGGKAGSHHTVVLRRMYAKRWVTRRRRFENRHGAGWEYAITATGQSALACNKVTTEISERMRATSLAKAKARLGVKP